MASYTIIRAVTESLLEILQKQFDGWSFRAAVRDGWRVRPTPVEVRP